MHPRHTTRCGHERSGRSTRTIPHASIPAPPRRGASAGSRERAGGGVVVEAAECVRNFQFPPPRRSHSRVTRRQRGRPPTNCDDCAVSARTRLPRLTCPHFLAPGVCADLILCGAPRDKRIQEEASERRTRPIVVLCRAVPCPCRAHPPHAGWRRTRQTARSATASAPPSRARSATRLSGSCWTRWCSSASGTCGRLGGRGRQWAPRMSRRRAATGGPAAHT